MANPVPELYGLRTTVLASETVALTPNMTHTVAGTDNGAAASADIELNVTGWASASQAVNVGMCVLGSSQTPGTGIGLFIVIDPQTKMAFVTPGPCPSTNGTVSPHHASATGTDARPHGVDAAPPTRTANVTRMMNNTNFPHGDIFDHEFPAGTGPQACQALCDNTSACYAWTFLKRGPNNGMSCCIKGPIPDRDGCPIPAPGMWSGAKTAGTVQCGGPSPPPPPPPSSGVPLFDATTLTVRLMPDRSVADMFVQGGRWAGTLAWLSKAPRAPNDSVVSVYSRTGGVSVDVGVWSMGCGWLNPSYTDRPTL